MQSLNQNVGRTLARSKASAGVLALVLSVLLPAHSNIAATDLEAFSAVDRQYLGLHSPAVAENDNLVTAGASHCCSHSVPPQRCAECLVRAMEPRSGGVSAVTENALSSHTVTGVLQGANGSCGARVATSLLAANCACVFDAVILRDHVVLGLRGHDGVYFETLEAGRQFGNLELRRHRMPPSGKPIRVDAAGYLPYYLDNLAARLTEIGRREDAERALMQGLELAPRAGRLHYNYGTLLLNTGRMREAERHLALAIRYEWDDADAWVNRGVALWKLGKSSKAMRCFETALEKDPRNRRALNNRDEMRRELAASH